MIFSSLCLPPEILNNFNYIFISMSFPKILNFAIIKPFVSSVDLHVQET